MCKGRELGRGYHVDLTLNVDAGRIPIFDFAINLVSVFISRREPPAQDEVPES